jgi:hypothetical protein
MDPAHISFVSIGYIFIGEADCVVAMESNFRRFDTPKTPTRTAFKLDMMEVRSDMELSKKIGLDLKTNPTQPALAVEDQSRSSMVILVSEPQRYHFLGFDGVSSGYAFNGDGSRKESI